MLDKIKLSLRRLGALPGSELLRVRCYLAAPDNKLPSTSKINQRQRNFPSISAKAFSTTFVKMNHLPQAWGRVSHEEAKEYWDLANIEVAAQR